MDLVSNFVGSISPSVFGKDAQGINTNIDLDDKTFSDMLEKQMNKNIEIERNIPNFKNNFGLSSGIDIGVFDGSVPQFDNVVSNTKNKFEAIKPIEKSENTVFNDFSGAHDLSTSEVVLFFNSLFDSKPSMTDSSNSGLFNFERKIAAGSYEKYAKNVVTDLNEFVSDTKRIKS